MNQYSEKITCGQCHYVFNRGAYVCQGCTGDIVYGANAHERSEATKAGASVFGIAALALTYGVPMLINSNFGTHIPTGWGMGFGGMIIAGIAAGVGATIFLSNLAKKMSDVVRTTRRRR